MLPMMMQCSTKDQLAVKVKTLRTWTPIRTPVHSRSMKTMGTILNTLVKTLKIIKSTVKITNKILITEDKHSTTKFKMLIKLK